MKSNLIYFTFLIIVLIGCAKSVTKITESIDGFDPKMNEFFFQEGSYWVYKCDSLNKTDSAYLYKIVSSSFTTFIGHGQAIITSYRQMLYHDQLFPETFYGGYLDCIIGGGIFRNITPPLPSHNEQDFLVYSTGTLPFLERFDSLKVGEVYYKDVQMRVLDSNTFYYAPEFGLIKKIMMDSVHVKTTWNLIRSRIILPANK
jgi:hypothetical protein